jgi:hypothetical protein
MLPTIHNKKKWQLRVFITPNVQFNQLEDMQKTTKLNLNIYQIRQCSIGLGLKYLRE